MACPVPDLSIRFRPVGQAELDLIRASGFRHFPPRLPEQAYFKPVLNLEYATQIAALNEKIVGVIEIVAEYRAETE